MPGRCFFARYSAKTASCPVCARDRPRAKASPSCALLRQGEGAEVPRRPQRTAQPPPAAAACRSPGGGRRGRRREPSTPSAESPTAPTTASSTRATKPRHWLSARTSSGERKGRARQTAAAPTSGADRAVRISRRGGPLLAPQAQKALPGQEEFAAHGDRRAAVLFADRVEERRVFAVDVQERAGRQARVPARKHLRQAVLGDVALQGEEDVRAPGRGVVREQPALQRNARRAIDRASALRAGG